MIAVPRRSFLIGLGLALSGLSLVSYADAADDDGHPHPTDPQSHASAASVGDGLRPNAFVHVAKSGVVTIVCARSEMGQGIRSSIPALIADEMGADMKHVKVVQADGDKRFGDQNTDGSHSIRGYYDDLRRVGAAARMMLVEAAAKRWRVSPTTCTARDHAVHHDATKRSIPFGDLALDAAKLPLPKRDAIVLRPASELRLVGKDLPLLDGPDIVTGRAAFGADVVVPEMLTAVVARPPVVGGKVARYDAKKALAVPGVKRVVELPVAARPFAFKPLGGIAVVAENTWAAMRGRAALEISWDAGENGSYDSRAYRETLVGAVQAPGTAVRNVGDVDAALGRAQRRVEAIYYAPHLAHASMEPPVALAKMDGSRCEVWTSTQNPQEARTEVAKALGIDEQNVTVHVTFLGGGFGRKSKPDYVAEAALVARAAGAPVRLQWTREDDVQHDYYHSVSAQRLVAGLDESGKVIAWQHRTAFPPIASTFSDATRPTKGELGQGITDLPLAIPNVRAEACSAKAHARIGWLRSVANIYHAFAVQSFFDELAHARGKDPLDNALELLGAPRLVTPAELGVDAVPNYGTPLSEQPIDTARHRRVLERVTELARWRDRSKDGRALGLAVHRSFLTYVAAVVSVKRDARGKVVADEAWIVADAGKIVNAERVRSQLEGAVVFALGHALYSEITMKGGATEQTNLRDYRILRMAEAPRAIHVEVVASDAPPGGIGEPGVPPIAPALANAVFALTGSRVRELPIARALGK